MKPRYASILILMTLPCCKREKPQAAAQTESPPKHEVSQEQPTANPKTNPQDLLKIFKEWTPQTAPAARKLVADYQNEKGIGTSDAWLEVYEDVSKNMSANDAQFVRIQICSIIIKHSDDSARIIGGLPSGELRSECVALVLGSDVPAGKIGEIYQALPESVDKSRLAEGYSVASFYKDGVKSAISAIESMESPDDKKKALKSLVDYGSRDLKLTMPVEIRAQIPQNRVFTESDRQGLLEYGEKIGAPLDVLQRLKPSN